MRVVLAEPFFQFAFGLIDAIEDPLWMNILRQFPQFRVGSLFDVLLL
jgi:hypothetical protein